jgi:hypothetical protein
VKTDEDRGVLWGLRPSRLDDQWPNDGYFGSNSVAPWQDGGVASTTAISEGAILVEQPFS